MSDLNEETVVLQDPVHGPIEMSSVCMKIINTPQFQRLRFIKQLGTTSFVYPGAVHTRFEHSIGTCHLASSMLKMLMWKQPDLDIDNDDLKCVSIAALCHDLGHGPFSHLFDRSFLPSFHPNWKHEEGSIRMLQHLITHNHLQAHFSTLDLIFINELILPPHVYQGRQANKWFLYEIVSNKRTGIDVDKWDYFSRDSHYLGLKCTFDCQRLMRFVKVMLVDGVRQICYRDKVCDNIVEMFTSRLRLFKTAYYHKTTLIIDHMVSEVFKKANPHLRIKGSNGVTFKLSQCIEDMTAYSRLTDDLLLQIYNSDDPLLTDAIGLIERIFKRQLPKLIGKIDSAHVDLDEKGVKTLMTTKSLLELDDVIVLKSTLDSGVGHTNPLNNCSGVGHTNPLNNCYFFSKSSTLDVFKMKTTQTEAIKKTNYFVYVNNSRHFKMASEAFEVLCGEYGLSFSKSKCEGREKRNVELTPNKEQKFENETVAKKVKLNL